MKRILIGLFAIILSCTVIMGNNVCIKNVQASAKSDKAIKNAKKNYKTIRKNLRKYKKIHSSSGCTDYWQKNTVRLTIVKPKKDEVLAIKGTTCEYYYASNQKLVFAYAYKKVKGKRKEYRAYYMGNKCYRYIGPDKKVHTYAKGKSPEKAPNMASRLYSKGYHNLHLLGIDDVF